MVHRRELKSENQNIIFIPFRASFDKTTCENKESFSIEVIEYLRSFLSRLYAIAVVKIEAIAERSAWQD